MKKRISLLLIVALLSTMLVACGGDKEDINGQEDVGIIEGMEKGNEEDIPDNDQDTVGKFVEEDGKLVYLDTENPLLDLEAIKIEIDKEANTASFIPADSEGNIGVDYFKFNYENDEFEKYYYVSAMGTGHYYYYDLEGSELLKVEDKDHNDSTESTKASGRWDGAVEKIEGEIRELEAYFESLEDMTIEEYMNK